jgi:hypothetical protein
LPTPRNPCSATAAGCLRFERSDRWIRVIDFVSFGFELAAVLAKMMSYVPTTYAALLARDAYMSDVRIVDGMMKVLDGNTGSGATARSHFPINSTPANDNPAGAAPSFGPG